MRVTDWLRYHAGKLIDEAPRRAFWALLGIAGVASFSVLFPYARYLWRVMGHWLVTPYMPYAASLIFLLIVILVLVANAWATRKKLRTLSISVDSLRPQSANAKAKFKSIRVVDSKLTLEWRVLQDPNVWIETPSLGKTSEGHRSTLLDGPFHADDVCGERLMTYRSASGTSYLHGRCPSCDKLLFVGSIPIIESDLNISVLEELQRLHRIRKNIFDGVSLERPQHWHLMQQPASEN